MPEDDEVWGDELVDINTTLDQYEEAGILDDFTENETY